MAVASMRGIGWAVCYEDPETGLIINQWINEHDVGHPAGLKPLLILDVFEHAYMTDYGIKRVDYLTAFFNNVKWEVVEQRLH
jgi:Fe-Mn family superoxide dismutase